ncbi:M10 family metallopeptidase C-terminal domain-containing protein [Limimaricola sp. G21655-S1]|uniref:M10 family metallopeptidase C-terminal domain-containing protein n=1 Tax=Limimaricola sp. G21655-S1 TaxID=3014768 RepID=UPI0022B07151|nr:M10 family metallopeptidase C-terminal domain-containing protein [Limimaricola sp. G21655-S1]MCZ4262839.1 M10 family metallopeptidase C-terminal domain-containing protein [Limimaricola sp. G21655-S1]
MSFQERPLPRNAKAQDIADYLLGGYNESTKIPYTFFDPDVRGPIKADIGGLNTEGKQLAKWAMNAWESVADVEFKLVNRGASLTFVDHRSGAHAETEANGDGTITKATINVSSGWVEKYGSGVDSYTFRTYMHEIGHVLGLGHTGPYNASADYKDAIFKNDSWQLSVMSYLGQDENPNINASRASNVMPMEADLLAIRELWGAPKDHYADGDTIWGIGSELDNYLGDMFRGMANYKKSDAYDLQPITLYIEDASGHDRIDFSHTGLHQTVDLRPGRISSVLSFKKNMLIAEDTLIEDFVSGDGIDKIIGNDSGNAIWGGGRDDLIKGLGGNDRLLGEAGKDRIFGGGGRDALYGGDHDDLLKGQSGRDKLWGDAGADKLLGNGGGDQIWGGDHSDILNGQGGRDKLWGEAGADTLIGGGGNDELYGGDQSDVLKGDAGNDLLNGGEAGDTLEGGSGNDELFGGAGLDLLKGGDGDDRLDGGESPDELFGGAGADVFVLGLGYGTEIVGDFVLGEDRIELDAALMVDLTAEAAAGLARDTADGDLILNFDGNRLLLADLAGTELTAESFVIV